MNNMNTMMEDKDMDASSVVGEDNSEVGNSFILPSITPQKHAAFSEW